MRRHLLPRARSRKAGAALPALTVLSLFLGGCPSGKGVPSITRMIQIPGGTFELGFRNQEGRPEACDGSASEELKRCDCGAFNQDALSAERLRSWIDDFTWVPRAQATVAAFEIDEHEVTNDQYAHCVDRGACTPPLSTEVTGVSVVSYYTEPEHDSSPVVWVTHQQAAEYCAFVGKRLPTEAEWERAARIDEQNQSSLTLLWEAKQPPNCFKGTPKFVVHDKCEPSPQPVGYSGWDRTSRQVSDMASNVAEWVLDGWHRYAYCKDRQPFSEACQLLGEDCADCQQADEGPTRDCAKSCLSRVEPQGEIHGLVVCRGGGLYAPFTGNAAEWVVRGGSWLDSQCYHRLYVRRKGVSAQQHVGFRCAR